jgi:hypothetical protein
MQTTVDHPVATAATPRNSQVAQYLETLQREQDRYLDAIGCARSVLGDDRSQLAQMSAVQGRLVRRFFDAQRAILQQRARVDDEFRAFLTSAVDGSRYERQLDALLDEWWQTERRETAASLELAAGELTIGDLDAAELEWAEQAVGLPVAALNSRPLPSSLVDALNGATSADLDRLLEDLVADLDAHLAVAAAAAAAPVTLPAPVPGDLVLLGGPDEVTRFDTFWSQPGTGLAIPAQTDEPTPLAWIPTQVVLPIVAVTAGLSIALLLIG